MSKVAFLQLHLFIFQFFFIVWFRIINNVYFKRRLQYLFSILNSVLIRSICLKWILKKFSTLLHSRFNYHTLPVTPFKLLKAKNILLHKLLLKYYFNQVKVLIQILRYIFHYFKKRMTVQISNPPFAPCLPYLRWQFTVN